MEHNWGILGKIWSITQKQNRQFDRHNRHKPTTYSPDLMPLEEVFGKIKYVLKANDKVFQASTVPTVWLAMAFSMITKNDCQASQRIHMIYRLVTEYTQVTITSV